MAVVHLHVVAKTLRLDLLGSVSKDGEPHGPRPGLGEVDGRTHTRAGGAAGGGRTHGAGQRGARRLGGDGTGSTVGRRPRHAPRWNDVGRERSLGGGRRRNAAVLQPVAASSWGERWIRCAAPRDQDQNGRQLRCLQGPARTPHTRGGGGKEDQTVGGGEERKGTRTTGSRTHKKSRETEEQGTGSRNRHGEVSGSEQRHPETDA
eukprot:scaffold2858_cov659-Pavlova_lutheri.AAC.177